MDYAIATQKHDRILSTLVSWRALPIKTLYEESGYGGTYRGFRALIQRLAKIKLIERFHAALSKEIFILPSEELTKIYEPEKSKNLVSATPMHDAVVANITRELTKFPIINNYTLEYQFRSEDHRVMRPDALLYGTKNGHSFKMAIEVELTAKSSERIINKFQSYASSTEIDFVLYIFDKESVFKSYVNQIMNVWDEKDYSNMKERVMFLFKQFPTALKLNLADDNLYFRGEVRKLGELFSDHIPEEFRVSSPLWSKNSFSSSVFGKNLKSD